MQMRVAPLRAVASCTLRIGARMSNVRECPPPNLFHFSIFPHNFIRPSLRCGWPTDRGRRRRGRGRSQHYCFFSYYSCFPSFFPSLSLPPSLLHSPPSLWAALVIKTVPHAAISTSLPSFDTTATPSPRRRHPCRLPASATGASHAALPAFLPLARRHPLPFLVLISFPPFVFTARDTTHTLFPIP